MRQAVAVHVRDGRRQVVARALVRALVEDTGAAEVVCDGESMRPTLVPGQPVAVRAARQYRPGDVALIETGVDRYVIHRLLGMVGPLVIHRGDARGALASMTHRRRLVARADLPARAVSLWQRVRGAGQALATFEYRRLFRA